MRRNNKWARDTVNAWLIRNDRLPIPDSADYLTAARMLSQEITGIDAPFQNREQATAYIRLRAKEFAR